MKMRRERTMRPSRTTVNRQTRGIRVIRVGAWAVLMGVIAGACAVGSPAWAAGGDQAAGAKLYAKHCTLCHGPEGKGDGPAGASLRPPAADLTSADVRGDSDEELLGIIANGKQGTAMPPWKGTLSEKQMQDVLAYIRSLSR